MIRKIIQCYTTCLIKKFNTLEREVVIHTLDSFSLLRPKCNGEQHYSIVDSFIRMDINEVFASPSNSIN